MNSQQLLKIFLLTMFIIPEISGITLFAAGHQTRDTSQIEVRQPDSSFVAAYRSQKEFSYSQPVVKINGWQQLLRYLRNWLGRLSKVAAALPWVMKAIFLLLILSSLFIIITQTKLYKVFYSGKEMESPGYRFSSVRNQFIDYDNEIRTQVNQKQFRVAVRLLYLKVIQQLRDKNIIQYSKDKTNIDYIRDLHDTNLKLMFSRVTLIYNHVWYGEVEIEEEQFLNFEKSFQSIFTSIDVQE